MRERSDLFCGGTGHPLARGGVWELFLERCDERLNFAEGTFTARDAYSSDLVAEFLFFSDDAMSERELESTARGRQGR